MTGSIACYKACQVISRLVQNGYALKTICSKNALNFIGKATLEGLTKNEVLTDMFAGKFSPMHIEISDWADLAVLCPATANMINKLSVGIADDYISTVFLAFDRKKPYWVVPAMNEKMYEHPTTQNSLKTISSWGVRILEAKEGWQACGKKGRGRMAEPEDIYSAIINSLADGDVNKKETGK